MFDTSIHLCSASALFSTSFIVQPLTMQLCLRVKLSVNMMHGVTAKLAPVGTKVTPLGRLGVCNWMLPPLLGMLCSRLLTVKLQPLCQLGRGRT